MYIYVRTMNTLSIAYASTVHTCKQTREYWSGIDFTIKHNYGVFELF